MSRQLKLGDAITRLAGALGIPQCERCEQRRKILNEIHTIGVREALKRMRALGVPAPSGRADSEQSIEEAIKKMEECCGD